MSNAILKAGLMGHAAGAKKHHDAARDLVKGKKARFITDFNGQPFGRSRPSLKGRIVVITSVYLGVSGRVAFGGELEDGRWINSGFSIDDVEFLEE